MANLTLRRSNSTLQLFGFPVPTDETKSFVLTLPCSEEWSTELLRRYYIEKLGDAIARARLEAYDQGWKDAKAKGRRRNSTNDFSRLLVI